MLVLDTDRSRNDFGRVPGLRVRGLAVVIERDRLTCDSTRAAQRFPLVQRVRDHLALPASRARFAPSSWRTIVSVVKRGHPPQDNGSRPRMSDFSSESLCPLTPIPV